MSEKRKPGLIAGRIMAATLSVVVVLATGAVWFGNKQLTSGGHTTDSINQIKPGQQGYVAPHLGNDVNLLLIGLDSRKDMNGNDLPTSLVEGELHAGSSAIGYYNTNVLILMHIPANGGTVTAYSIPRDSDVERPGGPATIPGLGTVQVPDMGKGKIKEAYGDAKNFADTKLAATGLKDKAKEEAESREVGREATIRAVQNLTGVHVDHLAEVNLLGFYDTVNAIGTIQVCLKAPAYDPIEDGAGTGLNLPAGVSTINAATALQFVRQRFHLPNGDLDRTHRQQAFLASVTRKLKQEGILNDIGSMQKLLDVVKNDVVIDDGWSVLDFASQASNLTGGNTEFITLPTTGTVMIGTESALTVESGGDQEDGRQRVHQRRRDRSAADHRLDRQLHSAPGSSVDDTDAAGEHLHRERHQDHGSGAEGLRRAVRRRHPGQQDRQRRQQRPAHDHPLRRRRGSPGQATPGQARYQDRADREQLGAQGQHRGDHRLRLQAAAGDDDHQHHAEAWPADLPVDQHVQRQLCRLLRAELRRGGRHVGVEERHPLRVLKYRGGTKTDAAGARSFVLLAPAPLFR